jgi:hypothetical protein
MLPAVKMPKIKVAPRRPPNATCPKTTERHPMPGTIIYIAGISNRVGLLPPQADRSTPGTGGNLGEKIEIFHLLILPRWVNPIEQLGTLNYLMLNLDN